MEAEASVPRRPGLLARVFAPYGVLRGNRSLQLLFGGQTISSFGDWLYTTALLVLAYDITRSGTAIALLTFVRLLPYALFLPFAGVLADRWDRKKIMIAADLGRAACMLGLLLVRSPETLWIAYPLVFAATSLSSLFRPAMSSALPGVVGDEQRLAEANTCWGQMDALAFVLGPGLGGVLVALGQTSGAFLINALTFLVSAATLLGVRLPPAEAPARDPDGGGWLGETLAGFRFLFRENEGVLAAFTLTVCGVTLMGGAFWSLIVVLAEETWGLGGEGTGFLNAAYGAGAVLGGFAVAPAISRFRLGRTFVWGTAVGALVAIGFGVAPRGVAPFALILLLGLTDVFAEVTATTVVQTATPNALLGRVFGAFEGSQVLAMLVGALLTGPLIDGIGPRGATIVLTFASVVVFLACLPRLRKLEDALGVRIFLRGVPVLAALPHRLLEDVASRVRLEHAHDGEAIVTEGDHGDRLYILKEGEVEVLAGGAGGGGIAVATLSKTDYFGETALLRDVPRTATVRACGPVELYSLSRDDFRQLLDRSKELRGAMMGTSDARTVETQNRLTVRR